MLQHQALHGERPPDESTGPTAVIQKAKAAMRDSPVKLADLALPSLGALGSVALSEEHNWGGMCLCCSVITPRGGYVHVQYSAAGAVV